MLNGRNILKYWMDIAASNEKKNGKTGGHICIYEVGKCKQGMKDQEMYLHGDHTVLYG